MNVPIIKLEVSAMKQTIMTALTEHAALIDSSIQQAVEDYCTPENIDAVVKSYAIETLNAAVKEEVRSFFGYGQAGRRAVREAVHHWLNEMYPVEGE